MPPSNFQLRLCMLLYILQNIPKKAERGSHSCFTDEKLEVSERLISTWSTLLSPWWVFCPPGRSWQGLGVASGCFCIHYPVIGVSGNNETAHASEKGPWIPSSILGHADSAFLTGRTNAASQGRGKCCSCLGPQGQECGPADRGLRASDPGHCCSDTVCLVYLPAGGLYQGEPQRLH